MRIRRQDIWKTVFKSIVDIILPVPVQINGMTIRKVTSNPGHKLQYSIRSRVVT